MGETTIGYGPLFSVLANPRRRTLVVLLAVTPHGSLDIATAANLLAVFQEGPDVLTKQITNVRTSLKRSHVAPSAMTEIIDSEKTNTSVSAQFI